ncbi:hypothetical protein M9H77_02079 [Catharanthus roseus]|uniref:Uncharacterized protein n=1 Tax=Catharanthus roseus TaxID=4058 RepID=A0ACC0C7K6_CATRO|nr:hypothetical protein M9H77_02079 [Catharanthus roseus]
MIHALSKEQPIQQVEGAKNGELLKQDLPSVVGPTLTVHSRMELIKSFLEAKVLEVKSKGFDPCSSNSISLGIRATFKGFRSYNSHGLYETLVQRTHQFYDGARHTSNPRDGRNGGLGGRGFQRSHEEFQKDEAWYEDNLSFKEDGYLNVGQEYFGSPYRGQQEDKVSRKDQIEGYRLLGHLPSLLWGQPQFRAPPDSPLGDRPTEEHDAMST